MRLATYSLLSGGAPRPALVSGDAELHDLAAEAQARSLAPEIDLRSMLGIIRGGPPVRAALDEIAREPRTPALSLLDVRLEAPIPHPARNIFCVGWNYLEHFQEGEKFRQAKQDLPAHPVFFSKATSAVNGPFDPIPFDPRVSTQIDWEVELGVVIGKQARHVSQKAALDYVAGYCTINDVSEREFQLERGSQWDKGKGCDTFGPLGPWLVTRDEIENPQKLAMWLDVNGKRMQTGNTRTMIFGVAKILSHLSEYMTLMPGDVIITGTPPGVGMGMKPKRFLKAGDVMTLGIEGLGQQTQRVVPFKR
jgi:2,4-diketo-3-deoxy-L-fuconate hydrolase